MALPTRPGTPGAALRGAGLDRVLPYLMLGPAIFLVLAVVVYPLFEGLRSSTGFFRFGRLVRSVGLDNYRQAFDDPLFAQALLTTARFVFLAVTIETVLGLGLALLLAREGRLVRRIRATLILPMIVTPVVVGIVFRLIYASDVGLLASLAHALGLSSPQILSNGDGAFWGLVVLDVWEWTPLLFLILLAGIQSLPIEPFEAAKVDGASGWRTFVDHTLPLLRPTILVAVTLRAIEALTTFDQVYVLTRGGPGTSTQLISIYGYQTFFQFQQVGYAAAMLFIVSLVVLLASGFAIALMWRRGR
jgi:multiple sugar transport system permease protein